MPPVSTTQIADLIMAPAQARARAAELVGQTQARALTLSGQGRAQMLQAIGQAGTDVTTSARQLVEQRKTDATDALKTREMQQRIAVGDAELSGMQRATKGRDVLAQAIQDGGDDHKKVYDAVVRAGFPDVAAGYLESATKHDEAWRSLKNGEIADADKASAFEGDQLQRIFQLPPDQRQSAWTAVQGTLKAHGVNVDGLSPAWDDSAAKAQLALTGPKPDLMAVPEGGLIDKNNPTGPPIVAGQPTAAHVEAARHNQAIEAIQRLTVGRQDAAQKETARHNAAMEQAANPFGALAPAGGAAPDYGYGNRYNSTAPKGLGFLGPLQRADGGVMSEYSVGVQIGGKETEIPTLVPTLTKAEVTHILNMREGDKLPDAIVQKARKYAETRIAAGKDPFAGPGEQQAIYPDLKRAATPQPSAAPTDPQLSGPQGPSGEELLKMLPPGIADQVRGLAEGRAPFPTGMSYAKLQPLIQLVSRYDPSFDAANYNARNKARTDLTSPSGTGGKTINGLNTALQHAGKLSDLIEKLDNFETPLANAVVNPLRTAVGNTAVTNFKAVAPQLAKEIERAWRGSGGSTSDIKDLIDSIGANLGRQQQREALASFVDLLKGKLENTEQQRDNALGPIAGAKVPVLYEQNKAIIEKIAQRAGGAASAESAPTPASMIEAIDAQGNVHHAPAGTPLPAGWKLK